MMSASVLAGSPALAAGTPCDALRDELRHLAATDPEAAEDKGHGEFLGKLLESKVVRPVAYDFPNQATSDMCHGIRSWFERAGLNTDVINALERDDFLCYSNPALYDEREHGGFIALAGMQGSAHCPIVQVIAFDSGKPELGFRYGEGCAPIGFQILRLGDRSYPSILEPHVDKAALDYRLDLFSGGDPDGDKICSLALRYQPQFRVEHWFGPKGEGDVNPELRAIIEPIVRERAAGSDAKALIAPILDHVRGDSPYDNALRGYPENPIGPIRYPNNNYDYSLPTFVPFANAPYANFYGNLAGDETPLIVDGHRLLLAFGFAVVTGDPPPEPGFGIFEWKGRDFEPVAGGIMSKHGTHPTIE